MTPPRATGTSEGNVSLTVDQLRAVIEEAAAQGAARTLARLGLDDEQSVQDLREVRDLLSAWRAARRVAWETAVKIVTTAVLALLALGFAWHMIDGRPPRPPGTQ